MVEKSDTTGFWPNLYEPLRHAGAKVAEWLAPASEAAGDKDVYRIAIELPGVDEKDIELNIDDGIVVLRGEKRTQRKEAGETWFFSERQYGSFSRSFRLPPDADTTNVDASLRDGVRNITIAKKTSTPSEQSKVHIRKD